MPLNWLSTRLCVSQVNAALSKYSLFILKLLPFSQSLLWIHATSTSSHLPVRAEEKKLCSKNTKTVSGVKILLHRSPSAFPLNVCFLRYNFQPRGACSKAAVHVTSCCKVYWQKLACKFSLTWELELCGVGDGIEAVLWTDAFLFLRDCVCVCSSGHQH